MEIKREKLLKAITLATTAVSRRATLPVLGCVRLGFERDNKWLTVDATGLDMTLETGFAVGDGDESGGDLPTVCVNAARLKTVLSAMESPTVELAAKRHGGQWTLSVKAGASRYNLLALDADKFLGALEQASPYVEFRMAESELARMLKTVAPAMSTDETRYILNGVHITRQSDGLFAEATDGRRLIRCYDKTAAERPDVRGVIPRAAVTSLLAMLDEEDRDEAIIRFSKDGRWIRVDCLAGILTSKLIEGQYPNTNQVIPEPKQWLRGMYGSALRAMVKRASLMVDKTPAVTLTTRPDGTVEVMTSHPDTGEFREEARIFYDGPEKEFRLKVNPRYILDGVPDAAGLSMGIIDENAPVLVSHEAERTLAVIMPMRQD